MTDLTMAVLRAQSAKTLVDPIEWAAKWRAEQSAGKWINPLVYVAHPVAPRAGEEIAICGRCKAEYTFAPNDPIDLRLVCDHDDPIKHSRDAAAIVTFNLRRAMRWWRAFHLAFPEITFLMPWYVGVTANGEADRELIERGLFDDEQTVMRCDGIINCGPRISSGMRREVGAAREVDIDVFQLIGTRCEPPPLLRARAWEVLPVELSA